MKNLQTGYITPQYHLTFDGQFTTVDDDVITDAYKRKLSNLVNWNANTHQTKTDKLSNDSISLTHD